MDVMDTQNPTYSDDELTAALAEHLASFDRDDSYRVERVLKRSDVETTELVCFNSCALRVLVEGRSAPLSANASMLRPRLAGHMSACLRPSVPDGVLSTCPGLSIAAVRATSLTW